MPSPRTPRIKARLAGPSGLAAALVLGAAGPASASVHRAAVSGPSHGWMPAAGGASATPESTISALAVLGACGIAGFLLLILGRRKPAEEAPPEQPPPPVDLEALMLTSRRAGTRGVATIGVDATTGTTGATGPDGAPAPLWVKRLNDQAPPTAEPAPTLDGAYRS